jgi:AraC-like DNA-binding protein
LLGPVSGAGQSRKGSSLYSRHGEALPALQEPEVPSGLEQSLVEQIVEFIDENYASPISLREVASAFGYSSCHLTNVFSRRTGTPITAWIIKRRVQAAQEHLGRPGVNVSAACEAAGFNDLCYFTRQFVRHVGMTPGRYRAFMGNRPQTKGHESRIAC